MTLEEVEKLYQELEEKNRYNANFINHYKMIPDLDKLLDILPMDVEARDFMLRKLFLSLGTIFKSDRRQNRTTKPELSRNWYKYREQMRKANKGCTKPLEFGPIL